jgi:hypothetical protein
MRVIYTTQEYALIIDTLKRAPTTYSLVERVRLVHKIEDRKTNQSKILLKSSIKFKPHQNVPIS